MNNKILALLVSAVMVMVAWVAAISVPGAEGEGDGSEKAPWMLMGNVALEYQMVPTESVNLEMDFNQIAFGKGDSDQKIIVEWASADENYEEGDFSVLNLLYTEVTDEDSDYYPGDTIVSVYPAENAAADAEISFSLDPRTDETVNPPKQVRGIYDLTIDAKEATTVGDVYFLFKVTVVGDYGANYGEYASYYYYGIHASVVDVKDEAAVILSEKSDQAEVTENDVLDDASGADPYVLKVPKDTEVENVFAYVTLENENENEVFDSEDFDFYAYGLPAGIAMKVNGEIAGKVAVTVTAAEEPTPFQVFAVHKENPGEVLTATYLWQVVAGDDEFEYQIDDGTVKPSSEPSYKVMNNTGEEITVSWTEKDGYRFEVYLTVAEDQDATDDATEFKMDITPDSGTSVVIGGEDVSLDGITGIVQVTIDMIPDTDGVTEPDATAVIHILVVGPVVHSGLQPVVTAI